VSDRKGAGVPGFNSRPEQGESFSPKQLEGRCFKPAARSFNDMKKDSITTFLVAAICFMAIAVLVVGAFVFDNQDVRDAKAWMK
jgi:hypothetical protein